MKTTQNKPKKQVAEGLKAIRQKTAVWETIETNESLIGSIFVLKQFMESDRFNTHHGSRALDAIFSSLIRSHYELLEAFEEEEITE